MSFCDLVVGAHRDIPTELSKPTTIKKETIDPKEEEAEGNTNFRSSSSNKPKPSESTSSGVAGGSSVGRQSLCWAEQVFKEEQEEEEGKLQVKSCPDMQANSDSQMSLDDSNTSGNRQIEIDILDSANVQKYEKLIRCDMIKSPFKRRLSGEADGNSNDADPDTADRYKKSKTHEDDHGRTDRFSRRRESTDSGTDGSSQSSRRPIEYEKDIETLVRRQKQIDYGKNTLGYENYLRQVPKEQRTKEHPKTPPKHIKYSRRAWDGLVRVWRKKLHCFDPDAKPEPDTAEDN